MKTIWRKIKIVFNLDWILISLLCGIAYLIPYPAHSIDFLILYFPAFFLAIVVRFVYKGWGDW